MSARHRQAKARLREWSYMLPLLGESLRIASILATGQKHVATPAQVAEHPIEVGDYVRWEQSAYYWVEGEVTEVASDNVQILVYAHGGGWLGLVGSRYRQLTSGKCKGRVSRIPRPASPTTDPLDVKHDGVTLRLLIEQDEMRQRTERPLRSFEPLMPIQRAAVSAHWSAELRAKVAASNAQRKAREVSVLCQGDFYDDEPWGSR